MGDFNAIITSADNIGGIEVLESEVREFANCLEKCELEEIRIVGTYYTWTNKTARSRLDRVLINQAWYSTFDFTQAMYKANGVSDHTPLLICFPNSPRPMLEFQYYDMWSNDPLFHGIIEAHYGTLQKGSKLSQLRSFLLQLRPSLKKLNKDKFHDLHAQQDKAREKLEQVQNHLSDDPSNIDLFMVLIGCTNQLREKCLGITKFKEDKLPLTYLEVPITASKLSKMECRALLDKITSKIKTWSSRHLSLTGRTRLINSVFFGLFNYWASIFILLQEDPGKLEWRRILWAKSSIPSHSFIAWLFMLQKLPVKSRLKRFTSFHKEDDDHLFFGYVLAKEVWKQVQDWRRMKANVFNHKQRMKSLMKLKGSLSFKRTSYAIFTACIYHIWSPRN
ncbi:hypothetical protein Cgig2_024524 [Carnegiea gigantea]|uniref:Reverse transcriptase zinc-binding domain-containing protein n=1 Tax=Carnegiea gigantea TaxID=171969 RepID=A0A9Q1GGQ0_9CARY|nr:hypothetical protein Cgig2_024524 [Carnegiea gigantea]